MTLTKPDMQRVDAIVGSVRAQLSIARDHGRPVHQILIGASDWELIMATQKVFQMVRFDTAQQLKLNIETGKTEGLDKIGKPKWLGGLDVIVLPMAETVLVI